MKTYYAIGPNHPQGAYKSNCQNFCRESFIISTQKKWGTEDLIIDRPYVIKIMTIKPSLKVSNHMHLVKNETFFLVSGKLNIDITNLATGETKTIKLVEFGDSITLTPEVPHSFYCPEGQECDTIFLECSTKDSSSDNYRFTSSSGPEENNNIR